MRRYVSVWWFAGVAAAAGLLLSAPETQTFPPRELAATVGFLLAAAVAERLSVRLDFEHSSESVSLIEAATGAALLVLDPLLAYVAVLGGVTVAQLTQRIPLFRIAFNVAQFSVATAGAVLVFRLLSPESPEPVVGLPQLGAVLVAMIVFGVVNWVAVTGVVSLHERRSIWVTSREVQLLSWPSFLGTTAVGVITAIVYLYEPWMTVLMVAPIATLIAAIRGTASSIRNYRRAATERDRLDRIVHSASDGIVLVDSEGRIEVWSPSVERLTGRDAAEVTGRPLGEVLPLTGPDGGPLDYLEALEAATEDEPTRRFEGTFVTPDRQVRAVRLAGTVVHDTQGWRLGAVILLHDVTREREVERLKDDFLMRVSHELRTPLTPIKGFAESLLIHGHEMPDDMRRTALERIAQRSDHLVRLVDNLLLVSTFSRPGEEASVQNAAFDAALVARQTVEGWRIASEERELTCEAEDAVRAWGDPLRTQQVLDVLIDNALRYSPADTPVRVTVREEGEEVVVEVDDQGRGVPADHRERIFERFHRVEDPMRMTTSGLGVGLHIARRLARTMHATLSLEDRPGPGSTFVLRLSTRPRVDEQASDAASAGQ